MNDTVEAVRLNLGRVFDWIYLIMMSGLAIFTLIIGILWFSELIPPSDFTPSQIFGSILILAAWILVQIIFSTRRRPQDE